MTVSEFFSYLLRREPTRDLGFELAAVYQARQIQHAPRQLLPVSFVRPHRPQVATSAPGLAAIEIVDAALSLAVRRESFTVGEAMELLSGVQNKVQEGPAAAITPIVLSAQRSYAELSLVDRSRVVDPLLDMRLTLSV